MKKMNLFGEPKAVEKQPEEVIFFTDENYQVYSIYPEEIFVRCTDKLRKEILQSKWNDKPLPQIPNSTKGFITDLSELGESHHITGLDNLFKFLRYHRAKVTSLDLSKSKFFKQLTARSVFYGLDNLKKVIMPEGSFTQIRTMFLDCYDEDDMEIDFAKSKFELGMFNKVTTQRGLVKLLHGHYCDGKFGEHPN